MDRANKEEGDLARKLCRRDLLREEESPEALVLAAE